MSRSPKSMKDFLVSAHEKEYIKSLLDKIDKARRQNERMAIIAYEDLASILNTEEMDIVDRVYDIDPASYGLKTPKQAVEPVPGNLVRIEPQPYHHKGKSYHTPIQYIPEAVYEASRLMADAMERQIGCSLLIESSYRSHAFQAIVFLSILTINTFDVPKAVKRAAIPGYSEHNTPSQLALDFQTINGLPSDENPQDFEGTEEYKWLNVHANRFGFFMSYPKDNPYGLMFEPWHWHHKLA